MNKKDFFIIGGGSLQVKFINKVKEAGYIVKENNVPTIFIC